MKVRIDIPIDLRLHNKGVFRISKQLPSSGEGTAWETIYSTDVISAGTYLADLEPGQYQKVLEATNGQLANSSTFKITQDAKQAKWPEKTHCLHLVSVMQLFLGLSVLFRSVVPQRPR